MTILFAYDSADNAHAAIVAYAAGACKPPRARDRFHALPKDAAKAERVAMSRLRRCPKVRRVSVSLFDYRPQYYPFGHRLWPGMPQVGTLPLSCLPCCPAFRRVAVRRVKPTGGYA